MRMLLHIVIIVLSYINVYGQQDSYIVKIHFLYGSKPKREFKKSEFKWFGGLHGGHVTLEIDDTDYSFGPMEKVHLFPHKKSPSSSFTGTNTNGKITNMVGCKYARVDIPISERQYYMIKYIASKYEENTPYDYAFFGMRCASSVHDLLGQSDVLQKKGRIGYIVSSFYPKLLRKKILRLAKINNYNIYLQEGKTTRKWEKD